MSTEVKTLVSTGIQSSLPQSFCKQVSGGSSFKLSNELPDIPLGPIRAQIRVKRNKFTDGKAPWAGIYVTFLETKDPQNADMPYSTVITANLRAIQDGLLGPSQNNPELMVVMPETAGWNASEGRIVLQ